ncbi:hypothetical protein [Saccharothrix yanglingensis]|uniref:Uncharacterized protein n=1 Tax=Saccharothrix yanglingensis TaxID=659496 RepID=A0ABU0X6F2_9PSEU|nr:hypothetical protein [Saccharothrix yanglingensis]MDQ2587698.1 hypothetical protein [Saccharothrix yanglingensis]
MKRWVVAVVALAGPILAGCGTPVEGRAVPAPRSSTAGASPDLVRWMNNYCGVANYLIASGGVQFPQPEGDPAALKKAFSDSLGRVEDVLEVALHDLDELTPAPQPAADTAVEVIAGPLGRARDKFVSAKSTVDGAPELTADVFSSVMQDLTEAVTVMNEAVEKLDVVSLPDEFKDAGEQAENCAS